NDGDIDLVINNQNEYASVYRNESNQRYHDRNYLAILLKGKGGNTQAIGSKIMVYTGGQVQYFEKMHTRGFQSCVTERIHVGLGSHRSADSVVVIWPNGARTVERLVQSGQLITLVQPDVPSGTRAINHLPKSDPLLTRVDTKIPYTHTEYGFNDFKRQPLLLTMLTNCGRSEEHTSELQSRENLVCRLLLEKKK